MQEQTPTLRVVNAEEIKPIQVWEHLYPDLRRTSTRHRSLMSRNWLQFSAKRSPVVSVRLGKGVFRALVDTGAEVGLILRA